MSHAAGALRRRLPPPLGPCRCRLPLAAAACKFFLVAGRMFEERWICLFPVARRGRENPVFVSQSACALVQGFLCIPLGPSEDAPAGSWLRDRTACSTVPEDNSPLLPQMQRRRRLGCCFSRLFTMSRRPEPSSSAPAPLVDSASSGICSGYIQRRALQ